MLCIDTHIPETERTEECLRAGRWEEQRMEECWGFGQQENGEPKRRSTGECMAGALEIQADGELRTVDTVP